MPTSCPFNPSPRLKTLVLDPARAYRCIVASLHLSRFLEPCRGFYIGPHFAGRVNRREVDSPLSASYNGRRAASFFIRDPTTRAPNVEREYSTTPLMTASNQHRVSGSRVSRSISRDAIDATSIFSMKHFASFHPVPCIPHLSASIFVSVICDL